MRTIDADALMEEFAEFVKDSNNSDFADVPTWNDAVSLLGSAPTIEPQRWIPVSERLPEKGERVLATVNFDDPFVCEIDYWEDARKAECDMEQMNFVESITAWMPLPDPYKEGEDDEAERR